MAVRLDPHKNAVGGSWGYAVFGFVIEGMEVVDIIVNAPTGPQGRTLQVAADGLRFRVLLDGLKGLPIAPGLYRPELTEHGAAPPRPRWGISMVHGRHPYLVRFECQWNP